METKVCTKCPEKGPQPLDAFSKNASGKYGRRSHCRACIRSGRRVYDQENLVQRRQSSRRWYSENKERGQETRRKWREDNAEQYKAAIREWRRNNPDKVREYRATQRARYASAFVEPVSLELLRLRDLACYLCDTPFGERDELHLDHKIPLSRTELGPTHSYDNCALVHRECNLRKKDKTPTEYWLYTYKEEPNV